MTARSFLFVIDVLEIGGIQRQLLEVCRALVARRDKVEVISFRSDDTAMVPLFQAAGCAVTLLHKVGRFDGQALRLYRALLRSTTANLIHAMTPQAGFWTAVLFPRGRRAVRFVGAFLNTYAFERLLPRLVERCIVAPRLDAVLVNSNAARHIYAKAISGTKRVVCIYNGVATAGSSDRDSIRRELGIDPRHLAIATVGRLVPVKGQTHLIAAFALLCERIPAARLHLIGDGPLRASLEHQAAELRVADRVRFHGENLQPERLLPAFDAFVLPSLSEGLPNALLEAMAAGLPCVASRVGGIPEMGEDAGIALIPPANPDELARALTPLLTSEPLRFTRGAQCRSTARKRFSMNTMIQQTLDFYDDLIDHSPRGDV